MRRTGDEIRGDGDEDSGVPHPRHTTALHGHGLAERALLDSYRSDRLHHAWLIGGPEGIGKATLAWRFARFLLARPDRRDEAVAHAHDLFIDASDPAAQRLAAGSHGDAFLLQREWNEKTKKPFSEIRVDDVRRALGLFQRASSAGGYRICIIDSADDLNRSSANALLKIIEEPPVRSIFLIVAHRPGQVMPTLVSRCRRLILSPLRTDDIESAIQGLGNPWSGMTADRIAAAASHGAGSVSEALRLLGGETLERDAAVRALLAALPHVDGRAVHRLADSIGMSDDRFSSAFGAILDWLAGETRRAAAGSGARGVVRYAEAWETIRAAGREAEVLNLDKRPLLLSVFAELAQVKRTA